MVFDHMRAAIAAAEPDKLAFVASAMAQAYGAGGLTDEQYEQLDGLLTARRRVGQAVSIRARKREAVCAQVLPASPHAAPARAHHRTGSRPRSTESMGRRRRWAAAGYLPPQIAAGVTAGEQAVLAVVGREIAIKGRCTLAVGHIGALAGVCATVVKRALRQARLLGLVTVEERRLTGFRNDTNVVRVMSREWAAWLRLRMPRANHAGLPGIGGTVVPSTCTRANSKEATARFRQGQGPIARPDRTTRPAPRTADA